MNIKFAKIGDVKLPTRGTEKSAGLDFYIPNNFGEHIILPNESIKIDSQIKCKVPENTALIGFNKSGVALRGLSIGACVIDEDYQGEISLHVFNRTNNPITIKGGEKLVQFIIIPVLYHTPIEVDESELFSETTERGEGGFGSTGLN